MTNAIKPNGDCIRCGHRFGGKVTCQECGVGRDRVVRNCRRHKIGGKRGRNSGTTNTAKNKK